MTPPLWQRGARPEELARVEQIDMLTAASAQALKDLARERAKITGRALKRALYVPVKERKAAE